MFESRDPIPPPADGTVGSALEGTVYYVQLAQALGVSVDTLHGWVRAGKIRQPVYFGSLARWPVSLAKLILAEGTQPAGTYPPADSPRAKQLKKLPKNAHHSLGKSLTTGRKPKATPKPRPKRKRNRKGGEK